MKRITALFLALLFCAALTACSTSEAAAQPTKLVALSVIKKSAPVNTPLPIATPTATVQEVTSQPTPTVSIEPVNLPADAIPQLYLNGNFMKPLSLDGIDPLNDKVVALTFDDGPHKTNTDKLVQILAENNAVATFFMLGENIEKYPDVVKRVYENGNEIGTHSYNHAHLTKLTMDQIITDQFAKTNDALEKIIGVRATFDRPPYGDMTEELAQSIGRAQIMWNVDPEDWKSENKSTEKLMDNIFNGKNGLGKVRDGAIILSHDIHETTVDAYDAIIKELKNQGYKFVTISQLMQIAKIRGKNVGYKFNGAPRTQSNTEAPETTVPEAINAE